MHMEIETLFVLVHLLVNSKIDNLVIEKKIYYGHLIKLIKIKLFIIFKMESQITWPMVRTKNFDERD